MRVPLLLLTLWLTGFSIAQRVREEEGSLKALESAIDLLMQFTPGLNGTPDSLSSSSALPTPTLSSNGVISKKRKKGPKKTIHQHTSFSSQALSYTHDVSASIQRHTSVALASIPSRPSRTPTSSFPPQSKQDHLKAQGKPANRIPACYGRRRGVSFTQYWIPKENEWDETNDGHRLYLSNIPEVPLLTEKNETIKMVSLAMYQKCRMEGTCLLETGEIINLAERMDRFEVLSAASREKTPFGKGEHRRLTPFVSIAANDLPPGQTLYLPELDGVDLGHMKHNGCVRVDDSGWSFQGCQIDFFVMSYTDYLWLNIEDEHVSPRVRNCTVLNYVTRDHLAFIQTNTTALQSLLPPRHAPSNKAGHVHKN